MESRNAVFQKLKPPCVALSQAALTLSGSRVDLRAVTDHLETLGDILRSVTSRKNALDAKLAEYVFFPISQVLKASQKVSIRVLELCLQCLAIMVDQGWQQDLPPQLAGQVVILCSMLGESEPKGLAFSESTDELQANAFQCLYHVFSVIETGSDTAKLLTRESNFPQLGQTISILLDSMENDGSAQVHIAATNALEALVSNVVDREVQASFLPGIVSKLTRVLTPQTKSRRNHRVLIGSLDILGILLRNVMGDNQSTHSHGDAAHGAGRGNQRRTASIINEEWQERAAIELKPALSSIMKLKAHSRDDVQDGLERLCLTLLQRCRKTLANCRNLAVETLITLSAAKPDRAMNIELQVLIDTDSTISGALQAILYDWLQSLTTAMQSSDEGRKATRMQQISKAYDLLLQAGIDTNTIDRMLATTLRDSVVVMLTVPAIKSPHSALTAPIQSMDLSTLNGGNIAMQFRSPLVWTKGQEGPMSGIEQLVRLASSSASAYNFAGDLARDLRQSHGEIQIANFWLLFTAIQSSLQSNNAVEDFLDLNSAGRSTCREQLEEVYSFSLSILDEVHHREVDPRLQALALRTLALRAETAGQDFRFELVDALYPVLHTLATPDENLQRDSITTLNIFTSACGYSSVKELIVANVDYLTNAVALKLNAFDVSPHAPQVLLMMVRLAGASLLPYLEDTVESIFAALEDYHGYPLLVELLFRVLGVIAEEGVKAPQLTITGGTVEDLNSILLERWQPTSIAGLTALLEDYGRQDAMRRQIYAEEREPHPKEPWKDPKETQCEEDDMEADDEQGQQVDSSDTTPPAPKTYNLLLKITDLTQHFLPSASPSLRASLLSLIRTTIPAIARHENSFLPLINTLWPEVVSRLDDGEAFIVATALEVVRLLCVHARDFMRTRIVQLWPRLEEINTTLLRGIERSNLHENSRPPSSSQASPLILRSGLHANQANARTMMATPPRYGDTSTELLWTNFVTCLTAVIRFVQVTPEMVDQALEMLQDVLWQDEVRAAFAEENGDALWLAQVRSGTLAKPLKPDIPTRFEDDQWRFAEVPG